MAEQDKKYYWLKLHDDFFSSKRIKKLRKLGSDFVIIYLKLQLLSITNGGYLEYAGIEETFSAELALDIDEDPDKVQITISYLQSCGLLEATDGGEFFLPYVERCTGSETVWAQKKREQRTLKGQSEDKVRKLSQLCPTEKEKEKDKEYIYIVEYLNKKAGKSFKATTATTKKHINARMKEGFTVDDFKLVVDSKVRAWGDDSRMREYLRPETLFGTKFEGYLNNAKTEVWNSETFNYDDAFDSLFKKYGEKGSKQEAKSEYLNMMRGVADPKNFSRILFEAIVLYTKENELQFRKQFEVWLKSNASTWMEKVNE